MTQHENIAQRAREMLGTPFHWRGRVPYVGLDCVGLVLLSLRQAGFRASMDGHYSRTTSASLMESQLLAIARKVESPQEGDIVVVRVGSEQLHLGIWAGETIIHAAAGVCVNGVVEQPIDGFEIVSIWRAK